MPPKGSRGAGVSAYLAPSCATRDTGRTMSEESTTPDLVELARRASEAANSRDVDALMAFYAPMP